MKKVLLGILAGLAIGVGVTAWLSRRTTAANSPASASSEPPAGASVGGPLHVTPAEQAKAGFVVATPTAVELQPETKAYGRVLDPTPLVNLLTDVETAQATLTASQKEFSRLQKLHAEDDNVSAQALEAAEAALKRDRAQVASARARLVAAWGPALVGRSDLRALVSAFVDQKAAVARLDVPPEEASSPPPSGVRCKPLVGEAAPRAAELLGVAPTADPQVQGAAYLVLLREQPPPPGTALIAYLAHEGPAQKTLTVPRSAIVYHEGSAWVYVLGEKDTFERRRVELGRALPDSFTVTAGVAENDRVLTTGTQQLLSNELQAAGGGE
jgi:hypothetical protein